MNVIVMSEMTI